MTKAQATRREASAHRIETPKNLSIRLDRLLAFIGYYQDMHRGETPTMECMANEMGTTKETVRYWIGIMEAEGRIRRIGFTPLRIMLKEGALPIERIRQMDDIANGPSVGGWGKQIADLPEKRKERFEGAEARRMQLARLIGEHWRERGVSPSLKQMMDGIGTSSGAIVTSMLGQLEEHGLVKRPVATQPYNVQLTEGGMSALGIRKKEEVRMETTQPKPQTVVVVRDRPKQKRRYRLRVNDETARMKTVAKALLDHHEKYGIWPQTATISQRCGYLSPNKPRKDMLRMVELGFVERVRVSRLSPWRLTDKGREELIDPEPDRIVADHNFTFQPPEREGAQQADPAALDQQSLIEDLQDQNRRLRERLAEALTANATPTSAPTLSTADMVLSLIEQGYSIRKL